MTGDFPPGLPRTGRLQVGVPRPEGPQQRVRLRPGQERGSLAPESRGSLESEEPSAARGEGLSSQAPASPQPRIIFLLKSRLHPGIPKTAAPPTPQSS